MAGAAQTWPALPATVVTQYETLRRAALGEALQPEARSGLFLFLNCGMWGWARKLPAQSIPEAPTPAPSSSSTPSREREAVIHVLAALAIAVHERRGL